MNEGRRKREEQEEHNKQWHRDERFLYMTTDEGRRKVEEFYLNEMRSQCQYKYAIEIEYVEYLSEIKYYAERLGIHDKKLQKI